MPRQPQPPSSRMDIRFFTGRSDSVDAQSPKNFSSSSVVIPCSEEAPESTPRRSASPPERQPQPSLTQSQSQPPPLFFQSHRERATLATLSPRRQRRQLRRERRWEQRIQMPDPAPHRSAQPASNLLPAERRWSAFDADGSATDRRRKRSKQRKEKPSVSKTISNEPQEAHQPVRKSKKSKANSPPPRQLTEPADRLQKQTDSTGDQLSTSENRPDRRQKCRSGGGRQSGCLQQRHRKDSSTEQPTDDEATRPAMENQQTGQRPVQQRPKKVWRLPRFSEDVVHPQLQAQDEDQMLFQQLSSVLHHQRDQLISTLPAPTEDRQEKIARHHKKTAAKLQQEDSLDRALHHKEKSVVPRIGRSNASEQSRVIRPRDHVHSVQDEGIVMRPRDHVHSVQDEGIVVRPRDYVHSVQDEGIVVRPRDHVHSVQDERIVVRPRDHVHSVQDEGIVVRPRDHAHSLQDEGIVVRPRDHVHSVQDEGIVVRPRDHVHSVQDEGIVVRPRDHVHSVQDEGIVVRPRQHGPSLSELRPRDLPVFFLPEQGSLEANSIRRSNRTVDHQRHAQPEPWRVNHQNNRLKREQLSPSHRRHRNSATQLDHREQPVNMGSGEREQALHQPNDSWPDKDLNQDKCQPDKVRRQLDHVVYSQHRVQRQHDHQDDAQHYQNRPQRPQDHVSCQQDHVQSHDGHVQHQLNYVQRQPNHVPQELRRDGNLSQKRREQFSYHRDLLVHCASHETVQEVQEHIEMHQWKDSKDEPAYSGAPDQETIVGNGVDCTPRQPVPLARQRNQRQPCLHLHAQQEQQQQQQQQPQHQQRLLDHKQQQQPQQQQQHQQRLLDHKQQQPQQQQQQQQRLLDHKQQQQPQQQQQHQQRVWQHGDSEPGNLPAENHEKSQIEDAGETLSGSETPSVTDSEQKSSSTQQQLQQLRRLQAHRLRRASSSSKTQIGQSGVKDVLVTSSQPDNADGRELPVLRVVVADSQEFSEPIVARLLFD